MSDGSKSRYVGASASMMRGGIANHDMDFKFIDNRHKMTLANRVWEREKGSHFEIELSRIKKGPSYRVGMSNCLLCVAEALQILYLLTLMVNC